MSARKRRSSSELEVETHDFVIRRAEVLMHFQGDAIGGSAAKHGVDPDLILAILVYEDLNRPRVLRRLENLLVRVPGVVLTVGIAQVRSSRPLSDAQSIQAMGPLLHASLTRRADSDPITQRWSVFRDYNGSDRYASNVEVIHQILAGRFFPHWQ